MATNTPAWLHRQVDQDAANLHSALEQSIKEQRNRERHSGDDSSSSRPPADLELATNNRDADLVLDLNNAFSDLNDPMGDTAIYIGAPPMMPDQTIKDHFRVVQHFDKVHIVQSAALRLMGEDSKFQKMLGPMSVRSERKLRKLGVLDIPEAQRGAKFKYYIDLRPPSEDEEAVILLTDLTCTKGVLNWHLARKKFDLNPFVVMGHDQLFKKPQPLLPLPGGRAEGAGTKGENQTDVSDAASKPGQVDSEYSFLRHWSAIERLLHAIQGHDPKLDSAPKVWTYFAVARYFGCATNERISGWITTWIYSGTNSNFIQCNPEVAYRIGMGIQSACLVRDAFSILVGERALREAYGEYNPDALSTRVNTVHGRTLELLDDDERNRIDHAASSLVRRMRVKIYHLCRDMDWLGHLTEYAKIDSLVAETDSEKHVIERAKLCVKEYVRSRIYYVLCQDQFSLDELEGDVASTTSFRPGNPQPYHQVYNSLNQPMRMFTKTFWIALSRTQFDTNRTSTASTGTIGNPMPTRYETALKALYVEDPMNGIKTMSRVQFDLAMEAVNSILDSREVGDLSIGKGKAKANEKGSDHAYLKTYGLTPEAINLSSLAIGGTSKRESTGPASPDAHDTPSKRRKTIEPDDTSQAIRTSTSPVSSVQLPEVFDVFHESTENLLSDHEERRDVTSQPQMSQLPIRPKHNSILEHVHDYVKQHIARPKRDPTETVEIIDQIPPSGNEKNPADNPPTVNEHVTDAWSGYWPDETTTAPEGAGNQISNLSNAPKRRSVEIEEDPFLDTNVDDNSYRDGARPLEYHYRIVPDKILGSVNSYIMDLCSKILHPPHLFQTAGILPTNLFDCLLCLEEDEFKYLPLWADGNDDGTGGVYDDFPLPILDAASEFVESFGPGRIKKAHDAPSSVSDAGTGSNFEDIGSSQALSTVGRASRDATDGTETVMSLNSSVLDAFDALDMETRSAVHMAGSAASIVNVETEGTIVGIDDNDDTDMEVEAHDRSDDEFDFDNDNDDDDNDTINGDDEDISPSLYEHIHPRTSRDKKEDDSEAGPAKSTSQSNSVVEDEERSMDKGKGKAREVFTDNEDSTDDDFELI